MMRSLAAILLAASLTACQFTPPLQQPAPEITGSPKFQFAKKCVDFYEIVSDLSIQRRVGGISQEQSDWLDPYIETGNAICQDDEIGDYSDVLVEIEGILAAIADEGGAF